MAADDHEEFVGERIAPAAGTADTAAMARGEPGLPARFAWRGTEYRVVAVMSTWKTSGPCRNGSDEVYLRRHWFKIRTAPPATMTIYFDRQARDRKKPRARWWLYSAKCQIVIWTNYWDFAGTSGASASNKRWPHGRTCQW